MPSKSPAQHRLMEAAAHTPGGYGGVPQSVGREFANADKRKKHSPSSPEEHMAKRRQSGHTLKGVAKEFGSSKSTVHRKTSPLASGYTRLGKA